MKKILISLIALLTLSISANAQQTYSLIQEIKKQMDPGQQQVLTEAQSRIQKGDDLRSKSNSLFQKAESYKQQAQSLKGLKKRKTLKQAEELEDQAIEYFINSSVQYGIANKKLYETYKQNLSKLAKDLSGNDKQQFLALVNKADQSYAKAKDLRRKGISSSTQEDKYKYYKQAEQLEKEAVELQEQAYSLYFDKKYQEPKQNNVQKKQPVQKQTTTTTTANNSNKQNQTKTNQSLPPQQYNTTPKTNSNVYFRIQVAASKVPLSAQKLQSIYPGQVYYEIDDYDHMYKYLTLKKFSTYEQAKEFKQKMNVPGAFIVAYKNGKRVRDISTVLK